ncbi:MAG TPA: hypothetical protein DDW76_32580 [Cyanobacteria bacterium UBA11369]|nr:hypothetical protein [Cyanobacteria bacterium UBA11371]HBE53368.1 hypothetical protein [Cyanobacteria bacterium UBA11369]
MRKFLIFGLILALVFFATTLLGYRDKVLTAFSDVQAEIVSKLTFKETTNSNAVEVNGINFETLIPKRVWKIPAKNSQAENPV